MKARKSGRRDTKGYGKERKKTRKNKTEEDRENPKLTKTEIRTMSK